MLVAWLWWHHDAFLLSVIRVSFAETPLNAIHASKPYCVIQVSQR